MRSLITSMGEILIDFLPIVEADKTTGFRMVPGGSPFNTALGIARLGQASAFACNTANDFFGRFLYSHIVSEQIDTRFVQEVEAQTTLAFVAMEDNEPAYAFYGDAAADTLMTAEQLPDALFAETAIFHCGSISLLRGSTPDAVVSAVDRLKGQALISFDPNLRPNLVKDEAAYRELLVYMFSQADIVKISAADLEWLAPDQAIEEVAREILGYGPALVVVTRGGQGSMALLARPDGSTLEASHPVFPINLVDTVGAGDSFSSGLLAGLAERGIYSRAALEDLEETELEKLLRFAAAVSGITCSRAGANPPTRAEVESFLAGVP
jgi:fructokinase